jgi:8-oxo-dGTP diphosphatase
METYSLERPVLSVDVVIFTVAQARLQVLLQRRGEEPFRDAWALPGVAMWVDETLEGAARRALHQKTQWSSEQSNTIYLEQLATFDALYRDPRGRTVSVAYLGLVQTVSATVENVCWQAVVDLPKRALPFDHDEIVQTAITRLQGKIRYTNVAKALLPETFRIEELHAVYAAILNRPINLTNFRTKLLKIRLIERISILNDVVGKQGGRPPHLYRFTQGQVEAEMHDFL